MLNTSYNLPNSNYSTCQAKVAGKPLIKNNQSDCYKPSFKGHLGMETIKSFGKTVPLIQETAFFRESSTLNFIKDYVQKNLNGSDSIRILDGACSTGEETFTLAMLFEGQAKKVKITGFDLGKKAVASAEKGSFSVSRVTNDNSVMKYYKNSAAFQDSYLAFNKNTEISKEQQLYQKMFNDFFTEVPPTNVKKTVGQKIKGFFLGKGRPDGLETKHYQIKPEKAGSCNFIQGDITKLDDIADDGQTDVLLFPNALYHLIANGNSFMRVPKSESEARPILENVFESVHNKLSKNGIFVMGEDEILQGGDTNLVQKVLLEKGFIPIYKKVDDLPCVWKKVEK